MIEKFFWILAIISLYASCVISETLPQTSDLVSGTPTGWLKLDGTPVTSILSCPHHGLDIGSKIITKTFPNWIGTTSVRLTMDITIVDQFGLNNYVSIYVNNNFITKLQGVVITGTDNCGSMFIDPTYSINVNFGLRKKYDDIIIKIIPELDQSSTGVMISNVYLDDYFALTRAGIIGIIVESITILIGIGFFIYFREQRKKDSIFEHRVKLDRLKSESGKVIGETEDGSFIAIQSHENLKKANSLEKNIQIFSNSKIEKRSPNTEKNKATRKSPKPNPHFVHPHHQLQSHRIDQQPIYSGSNHLNFENEAFKERDLVKKKLNFASEPVSKE